MRNWEFQLTHVDLLCLDLRHVYLRAASFFCPCWEKQPSNFRVWQRSSRHTVYRQSEWMPFTVCEVSENTCKKIYGYECFFYLYQVLKLSRYSSWICMDILTTGCQNVSYHWGRWHHPIGADGVRVQRHAPLTRGIVTPSCHSFL